MNKAIILTTKDDDTDYWVGKSIQWKKISSPLKKLKDIKRVFIYFTAFKETNGKRSYRGENASSIIYCGDFSKVKLNNEDRIRIEITKKCTPINIQLLRDSGIVAEKSCMRGNIIYLDEQKYNKLSNMFQERQK